MSIITDYMRKYYPSDTIRRIEMDEPCPPCREMMVLRDMLDREGIPWHDESDPLICRTRSEGTVEVTDLKGKRKERVLFSVISGHGTYGRSEGLLEAWFPWQPDPSGHLNAEEVIIGIRNAITWDGDMRKVVEVGE